MTTAQALWMIEIFYRACFLSGICQETGLSMSACGCFSGDEYRRPNLRRRNPVFL
jgi:hypothetical protein